MKFISWAKRSIKLLNRSFRDMISSDSFSKPKNHLSFSYNLKIKQPFKPSATLQQKKHNLKIAAERIRRNLVMPGDIFSFWKAVGNPNKSEFAVSRGIRGGVLQLERGGGLCQASGIIYHLSLMAGFQIIERYNHSKDLYTDETRFCPLGSDATVAYGYRDLRVRNNTDTPVYFELHVEDDCFTAFLFSEKEITMHDIHFEYQQRDGNILEAVAIDKSDGKIIATSIYERIEESV